MKMLNKLESPLLDRTEVDYVVDHSGKATSSYNSVKEMLVKELDVKDTGLLIVKNIHGVFGKENSKVKAYLYKNKDSLIKIEGKEAYKEEVKKEEIKIEKPSENVPKEEVKIEVVKQDDQESKTKE